MPYLAKPESVARRFWAKVDVTDGCWLWVGARSDFGYGNFSVRGRPTRSHRVMWEWVRGPIPDGLCVLHKCDVPACVRPGHLFLGTKADNTADMMRKGRNRQNPARGDAAAKVLTSTDVVEIRRLYQEGKGRFGKHPPGRRGAHVTQGALASMFGVSQVLICKIVGRKIWQSA